MDRQLLQRCICHTCVYAPIPDLHDSQLCTGHAPRLNRWVQVDELTFAATIVAGERMERTPGHESRRATREGNGTAADKQRRLHVHPFPDAEDSASTPA